MGRFMTVVPAAIVTGALIGVLKTHHNLNDDQSLALAVIATFAILYFTKDLDSEEEA